MANSMNYDEVLGLDDWTAFLGTDELHTQAQDSLWAAVGLQDPLLFDAPSQQPATNQPVQTKSRGRVYTGCLTCRERKIKCDERRPVCGNCHRSRLYVCRGYGSSDDHTSRRGPSQRLRSSLLSTPKIRAKYRTKASANHTVEAASVDRNRVRPSNALNLNHSLSGPVSTTDDIQNVAQATPRITITELENEYDSFLLGHYQDVVCHYMMPVIDGRRNPWSRLYLPLALGVPSTESQTALRNALLSMSAYHLSQAEDADNPRHLEYAINYRQTASDTLLQLTQQETLDLSSTEKLALVSTAMALLSTSVFGADQVDCTTYLRVAKQLLVQTGGEAFWMSTEVTRSLVQILSCYDVLTSTTSICCGSDNSVSEETQPPFADEYDLQSNQDNVEGAEDLGVQQDAHSSPGIESPVLSAIDRGDHYILGISFGVNRKTFSLLQRTLQLSNRITAHSGVATVSEEIADTIKILNEELGRHLRPFDLLHDELSLLERSIFSTQSGVSFMNNRTNDLPPIISNEIINNHQQSFHTAAILYFHRVVHSTAKTSSCSYLHCLPKETDCQDYVRQTLDTLENIECFTRDAETQPANTFWPAFIAAVEAVQIPLRHRAFIYMAKAAGKGLGNVTRAKEIVMETWRRTDRMLEGQPLKHGLGPIDWRQVMTDLQCKIMLT